jgi:hypothetical protein
VEHINNLMRKLSLIKKDLDQLQRACGTRGMGGGRAVRVDGGSVVQQQLHDVARVPQDRKHQRRPQIAFAQIRIGCGVQ